MSIKSELESLMQGKETSPVPEIEQWARENENSALHHDLKYDDAEGAAHLWRLDRIRRHISVLIVDSGGVRETISLTVDRSSGNGYRHTSDVLETPNLRAIALRDAVGEVARLEKKYEEFGFSELEPIWQALGEVKNKLHPRRARTAAGIIPQTSVAVV